MRLDEQIDEQIRIVDRLESRLVNAQRNRMSISDPILLGRYDELAAAKEKLSQLQLEHIDRVSNADSH